MGKEEEQLQFLGLIAIFKEATKIILAKPNIFTKICLAFILPISCFSLVYTQISHHFSTQTTLNYYASPFNLNNTQHFDPLTNTTQLLVYPYNNNNNNNNNFRSPFPSLGIKFLLFNAAYIVFAFVFSLLYMAATVYTIACIYIGKDVTFRKVLAAVPKVWKRLMVTLLCNFCIVFASVVVFAIVMVICMPILFTTSKSAVQVTIALLVMIIVMVYFVGSIYIAIYWQLANVISVVEKYCGFQAMKKSKQLIQGKVVTAIVILVIIGICSMLLELLINKRLVESDVWFGVKILYGVVSVVLRTFLSLYGIVVHTVFYFVCKSYHRENVDKSILADHLEAFLGEYVPLKNEAIEMSV